MFQHPHIYDYLTCPIPIRPWKLDPLVSFVAYFVRHFIRLFNSLCLLGKSYKTFNTNEDDVVSCCSSRQEKGETAKTKTEAWTIKNGEKNNFKLSFGRLRDKDYNVA